MVKRIQLAWRFCLDRVLGSSMRKRCFIGPFPITYLSLVLFTACLSGTDLLAQSGAGSALRFGSSNALVQVAHNASFNSYPFTISAWFRTANASNIVQGIVSKYLDASGNGWTLVVQNGRLRGFHYRTFANYSIDATSAAVVADGFWHHAAMTVDAAGGKLFLDGAQFGASSWTGTAGGATSTQPLFLGRYSHSIYPSFSGDLDEITYWNRALG